MVVGGPWKGIPTVFEFYVLPCCRTRLFDFFSALLKASNATMIEGQTNDALLSVMLHTFAQNVTSESILFHDRVLTALPSEGAVSRRTLPDDDAQVFAREGAGGRLGCGGRGKIAATGGILLHYNRPYGDLYMEVAEPFRRRGLGSYLVQELKRVCYEQGSVPAARCNPQNVASRKTLQKAGFVPCGHMVKASV